MKSWPFLLHTYVKRKQEASFKSLVEKCDGKSIVLQVDFSENATIASQREVQSAHWNHGQATLFTAHAWITSEGQNLVIVSDDFNLLASALHPTPVLSSSILDMGLNLDHVETTKI